MVHIKRFNESLEPSLKEDILKYLEENYNEEYFDQELSNRVFDYVDEDDIIGYGTEDEPDYEDAEDAYKNLCHGGAIEYDLMGEMEKDVGKHFGLEWSDELSDIVNDFFLDHCSWYDTFVFRKSTEPYRSIGDRMFGSIDLSDKLKGEDDNNGVKF